MKRAAEVEMVGEESSTEEREGSRGWIHVEEGDIHGKRWDERRRICED